MARLDDGSAWEQTSTGDALVFGGLAALVSFLFVVLVGVTIFGVTLAAASDEQRAARDAAEELERNASDGRAVYERHCAQCHGRFGEGGLGPSFAGVGARIPDEGAHRAVVETGKGRMPAFADTLTAEQIAAVVAYEREVLDTP